MDTNLPQSFSLVCGELCNQLYIKEYNKAKVNSIIDELNAKPYKVELFVRKQVSFVGYVNVLMNDDHVPCTFIKLDNNSYILGCCDTSNSSVCECQARRWIPSS